MTHGVEYRRREEDRLDAFVDLREERLACAFEQEGGDEEGRGHVRQRVGHDLDGRSVVDAQPEDEETGRCDQVDDSCNAEEPEQAGVEVTQALGEREPAREQRVVHQHDLNTPLCPARVLQHVVRVGTGGKPADHRFVHVTAVVAAPVQFEGRFHVFGDGGAAHAANFLEVLPTHDRRRAAEVARIPEVEPGVDHAVEHLTLVRYRGAAADAALGGRGIAEEVRRLHEEELLVLDEVADGLLQNVGRRHVVAVKEQDEFAARVPERVVDIACLRRAVRFPA